ncbi:MAG: hypothetical protein ACRC57_15255 [Sarcina sp.]
MPSLNPITQGVLIIMFLIIIALADIVVTNIELSRAKEEKDSEKDFRLTAALSEKMNYTFIGLSVVLVYYCAKFIFFLFAHFHKI